MSASSSSLPAISPLEHLQIEQVIAIALQEDINHSVDVTAQATIPTTAIAAAAFLAKESGTLAGVYVATRVFAHVDPGVTVEWFARDGERIAKGQKLGRVHGNAHSVLRAERVALNLMQRMSGVATQTAAMMDAVKPYKAVVLDTRKTVPGLRHIDKLAMRLGGGKNHRMGLWDMVLIKDNHVDVAGGVEQALAGTYKYLSGKGLLATVPVEIEVRNMQELQQVLDIADSRPNRVKVDRIMCDNFAVFDKAGRFDTTLLAEAVKLVRGRVPLEASGNINLSTIHAVAATGVDYISSGSMHHSVKALDISMKISEIRVSKL